MPYSLTWWLIRSILLPLKSELILCFKTHFCSREHHAYPYKTFHISLRCRELCQKDAVLLETNWNLLSTKSVVPSCSCFAIKTCSIEANTTLERGATGQNWIPFLFDIYWFNTICHTKNCRITAYFYQTEFS